MKPLRLLEDLHRRVLVHRRLVGALCAAVAVWLVMQAASAPAAPTTTVWTAARDLPSGTVIGPHDLHRTGFAAGTVPVAAVRSMRSLVGRTVATPMGTGEAVTGAHLVGTDRLAGYPGRSAVAVRIPDADVAALLTPGQRVGLVASDPQGGRPPERLVEDAAVLAVPGRRTADATAAMPGRLVVFAVPDGLADELAAAGTSRYLTVVWSR